MIQSHQNYNQESDLLKFGRRIFFDRQITNKDLLESHMKEVHDQQAQQNRFSSDQPAVYERVFVPEKRKIEDDIRDAEK